MSTSDAHTRFGEASIFNSWMNWKCVGLSFNIFSGFAMISAPDRCRAKLAKRPRMPRTQNRLVLFLGALGPLAPLAHPDSSVLPMELERRLAGDLAVLEEAP